MPNWRRSLTPGGTFFFTVVTDRRARFLTTPLARNVLSNTIRGCQSQWPFKIDAIVLLPDHLHTIWTLPLGDTDYSKRWAWIRKEFTKSWLSQGGNEQIQTAGRHRDQRRGVWQAKFWEHTIQDEEDFDRHFDYIHFNPVKHGLVKSPQEWPWSSIHRWVKKGVYPVDWAHGSDDVSLNFDDIKNSIGE